MQDGGDTDMAYVTVPKDLEKVKNKVVFNLTLRQILEPGER